MSAFVIWCGCGPLEARNTPIFKTISLKKVPRDLPFKAFWSGPPSILGGRDQTIANVTIHHVLVKTILVQI